MDRKPGASVRLKLMISYAAFLMVAGALLLAVVYVFLLRYVPTRSEPSLGPTSPGRYDLIRAFVPPAIWALVFLLVLGLVGGWILAGRMLAPLSRISAATQRVASGSLSHRIDLEGSSDEFRELADSFDAMLARLEAHDAEQRRFAANASHELRTPLAITQTLLDVARNEPHPDVAGLVERLRVVNTRAIELTEALLLLSRTEQRTFTRERIDLSLLADEATELLLPLAEHHGIAIENSGVVADTIGSRALLLQMTTNLVHNAIVHNRSEGGTIRVSATIVGELAVFSVENTGEVVPAQLVPTLTEPFQRGSSRLRSHESGVGLGLAIVKSIVDAHDGRLVIVARPEGGLRVTVELIATPASTSS